MTRWVAALAVAGSVLAYPLAAAAQNFEEGIKNGSLICGYFPTFSFAAMQNLNNIGKRSLCRWKCVYRTSSGKMHVNAGARNLGPYDRVGVNDSKKAITGLVAKVAGTGSCVEAKAKR
jgi:hypothetical protein